MGCSPFLKKLVATHLHNLFLKFSITHFFSESNTNNRRQSIMITRSDIYGYFAILISFKNEG